MADQRLDKLKIDRGAPPSESGLDRRWIAVSVGALLVMVAAIWWWTRPEVPTVRTAPAREVSAGGGGRGATILNASGYVTARLQATVSSKVTARVVEVLIEEGMEVAEGQLMARLDDSNTRVGLRLARAQETAARAQLQETRVRLAEADLELGRVRELVAAQIGSTADLDAAAAARDSLAARLEQQREQAEVARRQVGVWEQELADTEIRAPFAGVVVSKNAQPGEMISPAAAGGGFTRTGIGTVVDMASLEIEVDVNESYINRVYPGQVVEATLDAYSDWQIPARVIAIVPTADRQRATVKVRIGFDELDPRILPDMGVKVAFREAETGGDEQRTSIVVPRAAVSRDGGREVVWLVKDGFVERRAVAVGGDSPDGTLVLSGVGPGDQVVVESSLPLEDGQKVREESP